MYYILRSYLLLYISFRLYYRVHKSECENEKVTLKSTISWAYFTNHKKSTRYKNMQVIYFTLSWTQVDVRGVYVLVRLRSIWPSGYNTFLYCRIIENAQVYLYTYTPGESNFKSILTMAKPNSNHNFVLLLPNVINANFCRSAYRVIHACTHNMIKH